MDPLVEAMRLGSCKEKADFCYTLRRMLSHRKTSVAFVSSLLALLILVVVLVLVWRGQGPEFVRAESADGAWSVEGLFPSSVTPTIVRDEAASSRTLTAARGGVYVIEPTDISLPSPVILRVNLAKITPELSDDLTLGYFDIVSGIWRPVQTVKIAQMLQTRIDHFSAWSVWERRAVSLAPSDRKTLLDLVRAGVQNGYGWRVDFSYATIPDDFVLFEDQTDGYNCARAPRAVTQRDTIERAVTLNISGQETPGWVRASVEQFACVN